MQLKLKLHVLSLVKTIIGFGKPCQTVSPDGEVARVALFIFISSCVFVSALMTIKLVMMTTKMTQVARGPRPRLGASGWRAPSSPPDHQECLAPLEGEHHKQTIKHNKQTSKHNMGNR